MTSYASAEEPAATAPRWYAIQTRSRHEKCVAEQLRAKSLESFLPVQRCRHKWKNGVLAEVELPLFPGYLFARTTVRDRVRLLQVPGVVGLAAATARPAAVPDDDIDMLRKVTSNLRVQAYPYLKVGDRVRVTRGPLVGVEGIVSRHKQELRLVLSVDIIMRSVAVEISAFDIEALPVGQR